MILRHPDPMLSTVCEDAVPGMLDTNLIVTEIQHELRLNRRKGIGLAAPQIGHAKRIFVLDVKFLKMKCSPVFINPLIVAEGGGYIVENEGCLSFSDAVSIPVKRYRRVTVQATDLKGELFRVDVEDMAARCVQHEIDHLDGVTIWDKATDAQRKAATKKIVAKVKGRR